MKTHISIVKAFKFLFILFGILFYTTNLEAQYKVQDKIYVQDGKYFLPLVDGRVAMIRYGRVNDNAFASDSGDVFELPVSVSKICGYEINYCLAGKFILSASLAESRGEFSSGPYFVAIDTSNLLSIDNPSVQEYITGFEETFHRGGDLLLFNGKSLIENIIKSDSKKTFTDFDFTYDEVSNKLYVGSKPFDGSIDIWMYDIGKIGVGSYLNKNLTDKRSLKPSIIGNFSLEEGTGAFSLFSFGASVYIITTSGHIIYEIKNNELLKKDYFPEKLIEKGGDYSIIIDKDAHELIFIQKELINNENQLSFQQIVDRHGIKVRIE